MGKWRCRANLYLLFDLVREERPVRPVEIIGKRILPPAVKLPIHHSHTYEAPDAAGGLLGEVGILHEDVRFITASLLSILKIIKIHTRLKKAQAYIRHIAPCGRAYRGQYWCPSRQ